MKQNILISILVFALSFDVFSQENNEVKYSMDYDTGTYKYFGIGMCYDMSLNPFNSTIIALGLDGTYLGDKFYLYATSRIHLVSKLVDEFFKEPATRTIYSDEWSRDVTVMGTIFFNRYMQESRFPVTLKKSGNVEYVTFIPAKETVLLGVDMGFTYMTTYYKMGKADLTGINRQGEQVDFDGVASTFLTQSILRLGISKTKTVDFKVHTDKFGGKGSTGQTRYYINTLFAFGQKLDDVFRSFPEEPDIDVYQRLDINTNAKFLPIGAAIGIQSDGIGKRLNLGYGLEAGLMPGPRFHVLNNLYLDLKLRLNIGKKF